MLSTADSKWLAKTTIVKCLMLSNADIITDSNGTNSKICMLSTAASNWLAIKTIIWIVNRLPVKQSQHKVRHMWVCQ